MGNRKRIGKGKARFSEVTINEKKRDTANAEVQSDEKETADAEVQSTRVQGWVHLSSLTDLN